MSIVQSLLVVAVVASVPSSASANGLLYKLPADGSKVVYEMTIQGMDGKLMGNGTLTMSSVGKAKAGGKDCRWIEFTLEMSVMGREQIITTKILAPEEDLGKGKNPFKNPQRGWYQGSGGILMEIVDFTSPVAGPLPAFLAGPLADAKTIDVVEVETGLGKLKCAGEWGTHSYNRGGKNTNITYTTRLNAKSPFGVVHTRLAINKTRNGDPREILSLTFKLKSVGKNAKSRLPEQN